MFDRWPGLIVGVPHVAGAGDDTDDGNENGRSRVAREIAAYLGYERVSMTQDVYMSRGTNGIAAVAALDRLAPRIEVSKGWAGLGLVGRGPGWVAAELR